MRMMRQLRVVENDSMSVMEEKDDGEWWNKRKEIEDINEYG